ncbi:MULTISPECIES: hypothetical protein [Flavobacterium]|uniref:Cytochrome C551 n=1 Tax=Flavobacterium endoglycinae TaxID=2816357 RepID=A0ABX7QEM8_9FLAO|nr:MULTISPECIES: hypothetical protein [Flavobacterium]QSW88869.1 hypothetical protein J0383_21845 [Flavobacterium endoglycinae]
MKTILKIKLLVLTLVIGLFLSCKTNSASGEGVSSDSDAIKAGDSTSLNSGSKGTTRNNEGNQESDPATGDLKPGESKIDSTAAPKN